MPAGQEKETPKKTPDQLINEYLDGSLNTTLQLNDEHEVDEGKIKEIIYLKSFIFLQHLQRIDPKATYVVERMESDPPTGMKFIELKNKNETEAWCFVYIRTGHEIKLQIRHRFI